MPDIVTGNVAGFYYRGNYNFCQDIFTKISSNVSNFSATNERHPPRGRGLAVTQQLVPLFRLHRIPFFACKQRPSYPAAFPSWK
jgi:hypothetical protein